MKSAKTGEPAGTETVRSPSRMLVVAAQTRSAPALPGERRKLGENVSTLDV